MPPRRPILVSLLAVASMLVGCDRPPLHGIVLDPAPAAPPLELASAGGTHFALPEEKGRVVLLFFGYTHCPDVCPTTLTDWAGARRALRADTAQVRFVFVSVDPGRDTPASVAAYVTQFDSSFIGLASTDPELRQLTQDWGIAAFPEGDPRSIDYSVAHPAHTFAVDARGRLRLMIPPGVRGEALVQDIRRLR
jgi:protein SCO1/2